MSKIDIKVPKENNFLTILEQKGLTIENVAKSIKMTGIQDVKEKIEKLTAFAHGEATLNIHELVQLFSKDILGTTFDRMFNMGELRYNENLSRFLINKKWLSLSATKEKILTREGKEFDKNIVFTEEENLLNYYEYSPTYILLLKNYYGYTDEQLTNILQVDYNKLYDIENTGLRIDNVIAYKLAYIFKLPLEIILNPHVNIYIILPNRWKKIRTDRGWSAQELAEVLGKSRSNISAVENMNSNLSGRATVIAMKKLNLTFYDIHDMDGLMRKNENIMLKKILMKKGFKKDSRNNIKLICELLNISVEEMMEYLNFSYHAYKNMESGSQKISTIVMWKLCKKFRLPIESIINIDYFYDKFCKNE